MQTPQIEHSFSSNYVQALILFSNITPHLFLFLHFAVTLPLTPTLILCLFFSPTSVCFPCLFAFAFSYPDREQLQTIYSAYLQPVLQHSLGSQAAWASTGKTHQLAGSLVQLYEQVSNWTGCPFMFTSCNIFSPEILKA